MRNVKSQYLHLTRKTGFCFSRNMLFFFFFFLMFFLQFRFNIVIYKNNRVVCHSWIISDFSVNSCYTFVSDMEITTASHLNYIKHKAWDRQQFTLCALYISVKQTHIHPYTHVSSLDSDRSHASHTGSIFKNTSRYKSHELYRYLLFLWFISCGFFFLHRLQVFRNILRAQR